MCAECLAIQLHERDRLDPLMVRLLDNLELVAGHDMPALLRAVGVDREDLVDMLAELRQLDPGPVAPSRRGQWKPVVPDVFVRPGAGGEWQIELNAEVLPHVLVNRTYYAVGDAQGRAT